MALAPLRTFANRLLSEFGLETVQGGGEPSIREGLELIELFFNSLKNSDWDTMNSCLHPDFVYDGVDLNSNKDSVVEMWKALLGKPGSKVTVEDIRTTFGGAIVKWYLRYTPICSNDQIGVTVVSDFSIQDGMIWYQHDLVPRYLWARQAFGWRGWIAGWTGEQMFFKLVRKQSQQRLNELANPSSSAQTRAS